MTFDVHHDFPGLLDVLAQRAVWASKIAAKTTVPPASWAAPSSSPSQDQATNVAAIGSNMAVMLARVAGMKLSDPTSRQKGTIVPSTIIQPISDLTARPEASAAAASISAIG